MVERNGKGGRQEREALIKVWIEALKKSGIPYEHMHNYAKCTRNTITNWRKGCSTPSEDSIRLFMENVKEALINDSKLNVTVYQELKELSSSSSVVGFILSRVSQNSGAIAFIEFYLKEYPKAVEKDQLTSALQNATYRNYILDILYKKIQLKKESYKFFEAKCWMPSKEIARLNYKLLEGGSWLMLCFSDSKSSYGYKILMGIKDAYSDTDLRAISNYVRESQNSKKNKVDMVLLIAPEVVCENDRVNFVADNIYMERLTPIRQKGTFGRTFIYETNHDAENLVFANQLCDIIWEKIEKYLSMIYKNIMFRTIDDKVKDRNTECGFLWESGFANRHEANFECERIKEFMNLEKACNQSGNGSGRKSGNDVRDLAIAVGFVSFPIVIMLKQYFKRIVLLDNAIGSVAAYCEKFRDISGVEVYVFTSSIGNHVTNIRYLYNAADLVVIGLGYTSFFKNPKPYYEYVNTWLKEDGIAYLSYYNAEFIYDYVNRATLDENMDFRPIAGTKVAKVNMNRVGRYNIYCDLVAYKNIKEQIERYFELCGAFSYPLASISFAPNKRFIQNILNELDKEYAKKDISKGAQTFSNCRGCFLDLVVKKMMGCKIRLAELGPYTKEIGYSIFKNYRYELIGEEIRKDGQNYVKVLIMEEKMEEKEKTAAHHKTYYVVALPANKQLAEDSDNELILFNKRLKLLTISQLNELGFEIGGIIPFFHCDDETIRWVKFYDKSLAEMNHEFLFSASDRCDCVLRMTKDEFLVKLKEFEYDGSQNIGM